MIIAPSVLSLNYEDTKKELEELNESKAEWMHFDVMDGHFVPNLSFGPDILKGFVKGSDLLKDVHLMVEDPTYYSDVFIKAGADIITFHYEVFNDKDKCIALANSIREKGVKVGLSIKPKTDISVLKDSIPYFDLFLIMSVEPGFGGQSFMQEATSRIKKLRGWIDSCEYSPLIEVDGGINFETGKLCKDSGVDVLVAGSFIFKNDIKKTVEELWNL